jgi:hypothetical protein
MAFPKVLGVRGGANPPRGHEEKRGWASEGVCEVYKVGWVGYPLTHDFTNAWKCCKQVKARDD